MQNTRKPESHMAGYEKINVTRLSFVHYQHHDLAKAKQFLHDFGLVTAEESDNQIYFRGYGVDPYVYLAEQAPTAKRAFVGGTWAVESYHDLETAASHPNATAIKDNDGPGGGKIVSITDPNGFKVSFIHGQTLREREPQGLKSRIDGPQATSNQALEKPRKGTFRRFKPGPSPVHKLGHYGFIAPTFEAYQNTLDFYTSLMRIKLSDAVFDGVTGRDKTCFLHIDRGREYTDHHSIFFGTGQGPPDAPAFVHHASFEVNDMDSQLLGHKHLKENGWTNCWGVGRHVLGSQIFDYWFDASGNIIEHYSDGDLVNDDTPISREIEAPDTLYVWGPNIPLAFATGKVEDALPQRELVPPDPVTATAAKLTVSP